jgi:UDP-N-acetylmuramoyl-L-alanyl-D-glutamate--2,6-diaminopimelate ligase
MKLDHLIEELRPEKVSGKTTVEVKGIEADSRRIQPGYIFVAIPGREKNGEDYIAQARDRGAVGIVLQEFTSSVNSNLAQIKVSDSRRALAILSNAIFCHPAAGMKMIGVVGTNGKTTVTHLARSIYEAAGISTGLIGTNYYGIGERRLPADLTTPAPPRLQELLAEIKRANSSRVIIEVSSHAIAQHRLEGIDFQTAVFTNLSRDHLDYHRTMEEYRAVKTSFFQRFSRGERETGDKTVIVNSDDPLSRDIFQVIETPVITYGLRTRSNLFASDITLSRGGSTFNLHWKDSIYPVLINLPGRHNIYNALAAIGMGLSEAIDLPEILNALQQNCRISGRLEQIETGRGFDMFIDYAHTPDGLENVLEALREINYRRIIVVFGCGGDRDETKRPLMGEVASRLADMVILTTDNPRSEEPGKIIDDILSGIPPADKGVLAIVDRRDAIEEACKQAKTGDVVLIAGKGHECKQIFRDLIIPFSDRETARDILENM